METLPIGAPGLPSPFLRDFFAEGRKLKIITEGAPVGSLDAFNPFILDWQGNLLAVVATDDFVGTGEFGSFTRAVSGGKALGTMTCASYPTFVAWTAAIKRRYPRAASYLLNPTRQDPSKHCLLLSDIQSLIGLAQTLGMDGKQLRRGLGV